MINPLKRISQWLTERRVRKNIKGTCPECGALIRYDKHGRRVPINPLDGREHWPGVHYRCPDARAFDRHGRRGCDLRPHNLEPATEEEIEAEVKRELNQ